MLVLHLARDSMPSLTHTPYTPSLPSPSPDPARLYWEPEKIIGIRVSRNCHGIVGTVVTKPKMIINKGSAYFPEVFLFAWLCTGLLLGFSFLVILVELSIHFDCSHLLHLLKDYMFFRVAETVNEGFHCLSLQCSLKFNLSFPKE